MKNENEIENENRTQTVELDKILIDEIGQIGRYQIINILLAAIPVTFVAFAAAEYIFTTARLNTRCLIPQCDADNPEYAPSWLLSAIPGTSLADFDQCARFANTSAAPPTPPTPGTCPANLFDQNQLVPCEEYVHQSTHTVVYDFGLECDEWRRTLIGSIRNVGVLLSLPITGYISDRWGRSVALTFNAINIAWVGLLRVVLVSYEWFVALEAIESTIGGGVFSSCFILVTELVGPKYRVMAGALMSTFFATGEVIVALIAWGIPEWKKLTLVLYTPQLLMLSYYWIMPESVRWLMSKGKFAEAEKILKVAAKRNGKELSEKSIEQLKEVILQEEAHKSLKSPDEPLLVVKVLKSKVILMRCLITPFWWVTTLVVYYGLSINSVTLGGNPYLNYIYVTAIEIPGYWTTILVLDRIGRKTTLISGYLVCAVCQFAFIYTSSTNVTPTVSLCIYLLGKYSISVVMSAMYIYTAELYPTKHRHSLFGYSSMIGRIGSITAPLTPALKVYWDGIPSAIFGTMAVLSAGLVLTTPETLNTTLPDTMEQAEGIGTKKPPSENL